MAEYDSQQTGIQLGLPGIEQPPLSLIGHRPSIDLNARVWMSRVLQPGYFGLHSEDYQDVSGDLIARARPEELRSSLIDVAPNSRASIRYWWEEEKRPIYVALQPGEAKYLRFGVQALAGRIVDQEMVRLGRPDRPLNDEERADADRAVPRALGLKRAPLANLVKTTNYELKLVERFDEATLNYNLSRGLEGAARMDLAYLRTIAFGGMLSVVGEQRGWNSNMLNRARKIIDAGLYIHGTPQERAKRFRGMLQLYHDWSGFRSALFKTKVYEIDNEVQRHEAARA